MKLEFQTKEGHVTYAPPEAAKRMEDNKQFVWVKTSAGIKPAFMQS